MPLHEEIKTDKLKIVWGKDTRYWKMVSNGMELLKVCWFEVTGKVNVEKEKKYKVKFHVIVKKDAYGWKDTKVFVMVKTEKSGYKYKSMTLKDGDGKNDRADTIEADFTIEKEDIDKNPELRFGVYEVWSGKWKSGLVIEKAEVIEIP